VGSKSSVAHRYGGGSIVSRRYVRAHHSTGTPPSFRPHVVDPAAIGHVPPAEYAANYYLTRFLYPINDNRYLTRVLLALVHRSRLEGACQHANREHRSANERFPSSSAIWEQMP
jgi:hypothetical protein